MTRTIAYARLNNNIRLYPQEFGTAGFDLLRYGLLRGLRAAGAQIQIVSRVYREHSPYPYIPWKVPTTSVILLENASLNPMFEDKGEPHMLRVFRLLSGFAGVVAFLFDDVGLLFDREVDKYLKGWKRRGFDVRNIDLESNKRWVYLHRGEDENYVRQLFSKKVKRGGDLVFLPNGVDLDILAAHFPVWEKKQYDLMYAGYPRSPDRVKRMRKFYADSGGLLVGKDWGQVAGFEGCQRVADLPQCSLQGLLQASKATPLVGDSFYSRSGWHCFRYYESLMAGCLVFVADDYYQALKFSVDEKCVFSSGADLRQKVSALDPSIYLDLYRAQIERAAKNSWAHLAEKLFEAIDGLDTAPRSA